MPGQLTYYDILGVLPGASADDVQRSYDTKIAMLAHGLIAGAPSKVITAVDRARSALELARRTLTDPAGRRLYDEDSGVVRTGGGLARPLAVPSQGNWTWNGNVRGPDPDTPTEYLGMIADWLAPRRARPRRVAVPDVCGLFVTPARRLMSTCGLHAEVVQMTVKPKPVEGLVVDQSARPGELVRRSSTVMVQVWHPSQQRARGT